MAGNQALISVIIPTFNRADFLKVAIESVLAQTYRHFELLILDNYSSDHTPEIIDGFDDARIKYIRHQCNFGGVVNWIHGIYCSKGEYLSILCDDDFYKPNFLSSRINAFERFKDIQAVFTDYEFCDEHGRVTATSKMSFDSETVTYGKKLLLCVLRHTWFLSATLFRREIVLRYWEDSIRAGKAADTSLKVRMSLDTTNLVVWMSNHSMVVRQHLNQDSKIGGKQVLYGHIAAFNEPLMFGNYTWSYRLLLKQGAAWAYDILGRASWDEGEIKVARRSFLRQLSAFPLNVKIWLRLFRCYLTWMYPRPNMAVLCHGNGDCKSRTIKA